LKNQTLTVHDARGSTCLFDIAWAFGQELEVIFEFSRVLRWNFVTQYAVVPYLSLPLWKNFVVYRWKANELSWVFSCACSLQVCQVQNELMTFFVENATFVVRQ
jgi:hypothetical protein